MITADPIDKLVSSSDYQSTAEHLSLSQGFGHSQHSQGKLHKLIRHKLINQKLTIICHFVNSTHTHVCACMFLFCSNNVAASNYCLLHEVDVLCEWDASTLHLE